MTYHKGDGLRRAAAMAVPLPLWQSGALRKWTYQEIADRCGFGHRATAWRAVHDLAAYRAQYDKLVKAFE